MRFLSRAIVVFTLLLPFVTANQDCTSLSSKYFNWVASDGTLALRALYDEPDSVAISTACKKPLPLPETPECIFCNASNALLCHSNSAYTIPDPNDLPAKNISLYQISGAGVISIPPSKFSGLTIRRLVIENTNLTYISPKTFSGVTTVRCLFLRNNSIDYISEAESLFKPLYNLKTLSLEFDGIEQLLSYRSANLHNLQYFSLAGNTIYDLNLFFLQGSALKFLDLRNVIFETSPEELEESGLSLLPATLNTLDLSNASFSTDIMKKLFVLLKEKPISTLSVGFLKSNKSVELLVALSELNESLQYLSFEGTDLNEILYFDPTDSSYPSYFGRFPNVTELNMKNCNIQFLGDGNVFDMFPNLKMLSLSENYFSTIYPALFLHLHVLSYLDLSNNIIDIGEYDFKPREISLIEMDLSNDDLFLTPADSKMFFRTFPNLQHLSLCGTGLDTGIIKVLQSLKKLKFLDISKTLPTTNASPLIAAYNNMFQELNSSLEELHFASNNFNFDSNNPLDFSSLHLLKKLNLSNNLIREIAPSTLAPVLEILILSQNLITTWYSSTLPEQSPLQFLDLSSNQITYISDSMLDDFYLLKYLDLNSNPLMCHNKVVAIICADVKNNTHNLTMVNSENYQCYDMHSNGYRLFSQPEECDEYYEEVSTTTRKPKYTTTDFSQSMITYPAPYTYAPPTPTTKISQSDKYLKAFLWLVVVAAVLVTAGMFVYFKWWSIKCWVHRNLSLRKAKLLRKQGHLLGKPEVHYDVFVSYSDADRSWILDQLVPNLEAYGDISLCFHERDFQVGLSILENIIECMDRSHALLLVVSSAFVQSKWCQFEMHLAQYRLIETIRDQLVLVLLEDIPKKSRPQVLHHLMVTKTYLVWPSFGSQDSVELFWKRLKRALKPSQSIIFRV